MESPTPLFSNSPVDLSQLPEVERLEMISLEPAYRKVRILAGWIIAGILMLISWPVVLLESQLWPWGLVAAAFLTLTGLWIVWYNRISFPFIQYAVREKDIIFCTGVWWKYSTTIPFNRVQHCDIKQGILDRRFGLARLTIYTAGGTNTDMTIPGLLPETAEKLKVFILGSTEQAIEREDE